MVSFKTKIYKLEHLSGHYLDVPSTMVKKIGAFGKQRFICTVDKTMTWKCGLVAHKAGAAYILLNKKQMQTGVFNVGQQVNVSLKKDSSEYGMDVPKELSEVFKQDPEGKKRFDALAPGKRRYIIYYVNQVKSSELRIERAVRLINNVKRLPEGKETFAGILTK